MGCCHGKTKPITDPPAKNAPEGQGQPLKPLPQGQGEPHQGQSQPLIGPPQGQGKPQPPNQPSPNQVALLPNEVPPGLECLIPASMLIIKQRIEFFEVLTGYDKNNGYSIIDQHGNRIYIAAESTACCTRYCCGHPRPFEINVLDPLGRVVITCVRRSSGALACGCGMCGCGSVVEINDGMTKEPLGSVVQIRTCCKPIVHVQDAAGQVIFIISGPCGAHWSRFWRYILCGNKEFKILLPDGETEVGWIRRCRGFYWNISRWVPKVIFADIIVAFPADLDVRIKALLIGAIFSMPRFRLFDDKENLSVSVAGDGT